MGCRDQEKAKKELVQTIIKTVVENKLSYNELENIFEETKKQMKFIPYGS